METHDGTQFVRVESGKGQAIIDTYIYEITDGIAIIIPPYTRHYFRNTGLEDLKLYTLYSPPEHTDTFQNIRQSK